MSDAEAIMRLCDALLGRDLGRQGAQLVAEFQDRLDELRAWRRRMDTTIDRIEALEARCAVLDRPFFKPRRSDCQGEHITPSEHAPV